MRVRIYPLIIVLIVGAFACVPESKKILTKVAVNVHDPLFQAIQSHEYQSNFDSLHYYLRHEDPSYRYLAARAFSSNQNINSLDSLYPLLDDPIMKVRSMAAHSIGQIRDVESQEALMNGFRQKDTMSIDNNANAEILYSMGKLANKGIAEFIASAQGYRDSDTLLIESKLKSLYQFTLRNINSPLITDFAVKAIRNRRYTDLARLYAAHYLARSENLDIEKLKFQIAETFINEKNDHIKMALATALKHTSDKEIQTILLNQLDLDQDYRVTCNIIRTLNNYEYISTIEKVLALLKDENLHVGMCACQYIKQSGIKEDAIVYRQIAKENIPPSLMAELYNSIMSIIPHYYSKTKNATRWQIQQLIKEETDSYTIIKYLKALGQDPESYNYIIDFITEAEDIRIKTGGIEALEQLLEHDGFDKIYKTYNRFHRRKILDFIKEQILSNDEGIVGAAANMIANEKTGLKELIDSTEFLNTAKNNLEIPGQIESVHAIEYALAHLRGLNKATLTKVENNYTTDWTSLQDEDKSLMALVKTNKGVFSIELFPERAPAAVLNFINLSEENYFDEKIFHRVVPNFVIQTGSPRGDNYGGAAYTIPSNVSEAYYDDEGYVGMASAGLHTESTQWFVTHSPTPHLDGKYTIFGKINDGMDIAHKIQQGDKILDVIISAN